MFQFEVFVSRVFFVEIVLTFLVEILESPLLKVLVASLVQKLTALIMFVMYREPVNVFNVITVALGSIGPVSAVPLALGEFTMVFNCKCRTITVV